MSKPSDRFTDSLAWDTLTLTQWHELITAMLQAHDVEAVPGVLALMAVHGFADEAEDLRRTMLTLGRQS